MLGIEKKKKLLQPLIAHVQVLHLTRFCITHCAENIALVLKVQKMEYLVTMSVHTHRKYYFDNAKHDIDILPFFKRADISPLFP